MKFYFQECFKGDSFDLYQNLLENKETTIEDKIMGIKRVNDGIKKISIAQKL